MKYLVWLKKLPQGSAVWDYVKVLFRLIVVDLFKTMDRIVVAAQWGFGFVFGAMLAFAFFTWLVPPIN